MRKTLAIPFVVAGLVSSALPARAADVLATAPARESALVPACSDPAVLAEVEDQFEDGAPQVLEARLTVLQFSNMHEKAYVPRVMAGIPPAHPIERRYCQAQALISDGKQRTVYYVVEYPMGFAATGRWLGFLSPVKAWKAQGCVLGLDQWRVYGANCQSLRRVPPEGRTADRYEAQQAARYVVK